MLCLFCNGTDSAYTPKPGKKFICSHCVQLLLEADQVDLKKAYIKAISMGCINKAEAIESFLIEKEDNDGEPNRKSTLRNFNRKGVARPSRSQKKRP